MLQLPSRRSLNAVLIIVWCWPTFPGYFASCDITFKVYLQTGESDKVVLKDELCQAYGRGDGHTPKPILQKDEEKEEGEEKRESGGNGC